MDSANARIAMAELGLFTISVLGAFSELHKARVHLIQINCTNEPINLFPFLIHMNILLWWCTGSFVSGWSLATDRQMQPICTQIQRRCIAVS